MKYLIDTDWIIHALHGEKRVMRKLLELKGDGLAISIISVAELYEGVYRSPDSTSDEKVLGDFMSGVSVLAISGQICKTFGKERARLRKEGKLIGDFDLLIASTCVHHELTLLTDNIREFERVENLKILK
ncbi:MAG: type II toxin-antitoxin system VapC family toxin [Dehalococcoidia bacterium]